MIFCVTFPMRGRGDEMRRDRKMGGMKKMVMIEGGEREVREKENVDRRMKRSGEGVLHLGTIVICPYDPVSAAAVQVPTIIESAHRT